MNGDERLSATGTEVFNLSPDIVQIPENLLFALSRQSGDSQMPEIVNLE